jgi:hypothetical protein
MKKVLSYILLSLLGTSTLLLSPDSRAERFAAEAVYAGNPVKDDADAVVYPNPALDHIFVRLDLIDPVMSGHTFKFEIRSILGNTMPVNAERADEHSYRIDTNDYPAGYYLLIVRCEDCNQQVNGMRRVFKFLKQ